MARPLRRSWSEWTPTDVARHNAEKAHSSPPPPPRAAIEASVMVSPPPAPTKYRSESVMAEGQRFDSKREYETWVELKQREAAGEIEQLERQVEYPLHAYCVHDGVIQGIQVGSYVADFRFVDRRDHQTKVMDAKGYRTPLFLWKKKHFEREYGLSLHLV